MFEPRPKAKMTVEQTDGHRKLAGAVERAFLNPHRLVVIVAEQNENGEMTLRPVVLDPKSKDPVSRFLHSRYERLRKGLRECEERRRVGSKRGQRMSLARRQEIKDLKLSLRARYDILLGRDEIKPVHLQKDAEGNFSDWSPGEPFENEEEQVFWGLVMKLPGLVETTTFSDETVRELFKDAIRIRCQMATGGTDALRQEADDEWSGSFSGRWNSFYEGKDSNSQEIFARVLRNIGEALGL